nr:immunoglobulin light chain junction region [Macaca mulatta]MOW31283.1 immunoglobulin light chain junction region [Macaca mulatta]MOW31473.1 immunoglobulin light chain junction region [Macaca mulatta]MOW31586.1 immunoglobulin light chain junction region [Macaca mulatta]MOW31650.1 immunoglobulin light chain junction region [Macaca mulatta]
DYYCQVCDSSCDHPVF